MRVTTSNVFSPNEADGNLFYTLANLLHFPTDEEVLRREVWFRRGEVVTSEEVAELERNLRALGLFSSVRATMTPVAEDAVDLSVDTRDRFSLGASAGVSRVGGLTKWNTRVSESNLFGTGKRISIGGKRSDGEHTESLEYWDPQLLGSWHTMRTRVEQTEEGYRADCAVERPFHRLLDRHAYGIETTNAEENVDYYRSGASVAEIPLERHGLRLYGAAASGSRWNRTAIGLDARASTAAYGTAFGPDASRFRVPGDTRQLEVGPYLTHDYRPAFDKVERLDALDYVEDLPLGASLLARLAARTRMEVDRGTQTEPVVELRTRIAVKPADRLYATLEAGGDVRWRSEGLGGWTAGIALHAFALSLPRQTLAASATFDAVAEHEDLTPQLTLGEDSGLRGYPARQFAGDRFARLNLEDRIDTGLEILSVRVGAVAFFDTGWIHDRSQDLTFDSPRRSAGLGLRLGSKRLFGAKVLRVDFAWPLDRFDGESHGVSISFASGQAFTFFGNANELRRDL